MSLIEKKMYMIKGHIITVSLACLILPSYDIVESYVNNLPHFRRCRHLSCHDRNQHSSRLLQYRDASCSLGPQRFPSHPRRRRSLLQLPAELPDSAETHGSIRSRHQEDDDPMPDCASTPGPQLLSRFPTFFARSRSPCYRSLLP